MMFKNRGVNTFARRCIFKVFCHMMVCVMNRLKYVTVNLLQLSNLIGSSVSHDRSIRIFKNTCPQMRFQSYTGREDSESTWQGLNLDRIVFSCSSIMIPQGSVQLFNKVLIQPCVWGLILIVRVSWRRILVDVCVLCVWTWVWMEDY